MMRTTGGANVKTDRVAEMFAAIPDGNMEVIKSCCAPGAVVWKNGDESEMSVAETCEGLAKILAATKWAACENQRIVRTGNLCFVQHDLNGQTNSGERIHLPVIMRIVSDDDGRLTRTEEYIDSRGFDILS